MSRDSLGDLSEVGRDELIMKVCDILKQDHTNVKQEKEDVQREKDALKKKAQELEKRERQLQERERAVEEHRQSIDGLRWAADEDRQFEEEPRQAVAPNNDQRVPKRFSGEPAELFTPGSGPRLTSPGGPGSAPLLTSPAGTGPPGAGLLTSPAGTGPPGAGLLTSPAGLANKLISPAGTGQLKSPAGTAQLSPAGTAQLESPGATLLAGPPPVRRISGVGAGSASKLKDLWNDRCSQSGRRTDSTAGEINNGPVRRRGTGPSFPSGTGSATRAPAARVSLQDLLNQEEAEKNVGVKDAPSSAPRSATKNTWKNQTPPSSRISPPVSSDPRGVLPKVSLEQLLAQDEAAKSKTTVRSLFD